MAYYLFGPYMWLFQVTAALLITAALGAMVLAARDQVTVPTRYVELEERTEDAIEEGGAR